MELDGRPFHITRNLELALRHLRLERKERRLWADSLCINQEDIGERNQQVAQMRSIYSAARESVIFLGAATEGSNALLGAIQESQEQISQAATKGAVVRCLFAASGLRKKELAEKAIEILWRPYWKRIWIFQEVVVSQNPWVQCGSVKVPWEYFCQALVALLDSDSKYFGGGCRNEPKERLEDIYWERRAYRHAQGINQSLPSWDMSSGDSFEGRMKLLDLLVTKRGSETSDSRDMVFALFGLAARPKAQSPMSITYDDSPSQVYMKAVKYLLGNDGSYEVLSHAGLQQSISQPLPNLPSWAPDWRSRSDYKYKIIDWMPVSSPLTEEQVKLNYVCLEDHRILACAGFVFDTIQSVSDSAHEEIKLSQGSIGRVIWDSKLHRRKLIEHGVNSTLSTKLGSVQSLFSSNHPLTYRRKLLRLGEEYCA
jgi:hypothetical protein